MHKRTFDSITQKGGTNQEEPTKNTRQTSTKFDQNKCIICNCLKKRGDAHFSLVCTMQMQNTFQSAVLAHSDDNLRVKVTGQDLIALEAKYHKNCLAQLLVKSGRLSQTSNAQTEDVFSKSFNMMLSDLEGISRGRAFDMSFLLAKYRGYLEQNGYEHAMGYRTEKLKSRLLNHYNGSVTFHKPQSANKPEIVFSSDINLMKTINKIVELEQKVAEEAIEMEMELPEKDYESLSLFHAATTL